MTSPPQGWGRVLLFAIVAVVASGFWLFDVLVPRDEERMTEYARDYVKGMRVIVPIVAIAFGAAALWFTWELLR